MTAGYSGTPLVKKLGIKPGMTVLVLEAPEHYFDRLVKLPEQTTVTDPSSDESADFIHLFARDSETLHALFPLAKTRLEKNGMLWVSWIKGASKLETDINENDVRSLGLQLGLVDVKICAVNNDWSGLKFMYRKKDR